MSELTVIVPSRGRPEAVAELADAFAATVRGDTQLIVAIDDDDPVEDDYRLVASERNLACIVSHNASMVEALNTAALMVAEHTFAVGFMGDDHRPRSDGWDVTYLDALRQLRIGMVYGNDLLQRHNLPTQVAMTADIVATLGYMAPPVLTHLYVDNAWLAIGTALNRISYLPDVIVEHMHPVAGKADWDDGYARVNAAAVYARDKQFFARWLRDELPDAVDKIRAVMA